MRHAAQMAGDLTRQNVFGGKLEDRRHAIEAFVQCNENVKDRVPVERLLVGLALLYFLSETAFRRP
jgi:hypothetical protein